MSPGERGNHPSFVIREQPLINGAVAANEQDPRVRIAVAEFDGDRQSGGQVPASSPTCQDHGQRANHTVAGQLANLGGRSNSGERRTERAVGPPFERPPV